MRVRAIIPVVALLSVSCAGVGEEDGTIDCSDGQCDVSGNEALCQAKVANRGTVDVERDYLPRVIACENGGADFEALKAQAVAARSYLYYIARVERRALADSQRDQVLTCKTAPGPDHIRAVQETSGQILTYRNSYVAAFYVGGAIQMPPTCEGGTSGDPKGTERHVTYNAGRSGADIIQSSLGSRDPSVFANRGCMSQNGSHCLSQLGFSYLDILHYYYGDDIELTQMVGSCIDPSGIVDPSAGIGSPCEDDDGCDFMANGEVAECVARFDESTQMDAGFCSVGCDGTCPGAGTMCTELESGLGFGQCAKACSSANDFCRKIPGTTCSVMARYAGTGLSNEVQALCVPPDAPAVECTAAGRLGECIDTDYVNCGGQLHTGFCPGDATIRCCTQ